MIQFKTYMDNRQYYQNITLPIAFSNTDFFVVVSAFDPSRDTFKCAVQKIVSTDTIQLYHTDSKKWTVIAIGY